MESPVVAVPRLLIPVASIPRPAAGSPSFGCGTRYDAVFIRAPGSESRTLHPNGKERGSGRVQRLGGMVDSLLPTHTRAGGPAS